jgi:hypothetical protein
MKKSTFTRWFSVWLLASGFLWWAGFSIRSAAATGKARNAPATDPRLDMVTALQAMGLIPHWAIRRRFLAALSEPGMSNTPIFRRTER